MSTVQPFDTTTSALQSLSALTPVELSRSYAAGTVVAAVSITGVALDPKVAVSRANTLGTPWYLENAPWFQGFGATLRMDATGAAIQATLLPPGTPGDYRLILVPGQYVSIGQAMALGAGSLGSVQGGAVQAGSGLKQAAGSVLGAVGGVASGVGNTVRYLPWLIPVGLACAVAGAVIWGIARKKGKK